MTAFRCSNEFAIAALDAGLAVIGTSGFIKIYTGAIPATVEAAATGTLLGTLALSATAFAGATDANPGATASASAITNDSSADNTGTAGYFRVVKADGTTGVIQGDCGVSAADMIMNTTSVTAGLAISISSYVVVLPET